MTAKEVIQSFWHSECGLNGAAFTYSEAHTHPTHTLTHTQSPATSSVKQHNSICGQPHLQTQLLSNDGVLAEHLVCLRRVMCGTDERPIIKAGFDQLHRRVRWRQMCCLSDLFNTFVYRHLKRSLKSALKLAVPGVCSARQCSDSRSAVSAYLHPVNDVLTGPGMLCISNQPG